MKFNDIVCRYDNLPPHSEWKLARITDVSSNSDGKVRKLKLIFGDIPFSKGNKPVSRTVYLERPVHGVFTLIWTVTAPVIV